MNLCTYFSKIIIYLWRKYRLYLAPINLEIHVANHCNLNCKGCNHYSPIAEPQFCNVEDLRKTLNHLKGIKINFKLLGGEPLLNPEIVDIIILIRDIFKKSKIEIITNGILLQSKFIKKLPLNFFEICKNKKIQIGITKYPISINYSEIEQILENNNICYRIFGDHRNKNGFIEFKLENNIDDIKFKFFKCTETNCLQLVGDKIYGCSECAYSYLLNKQFNTNFNINIKDYIHIFDIHNLRDLKKFRRTPKNFCGYCVFPRKNVEWEISRKDLNEWVLE